MGKLLLAVLVGVGLWFLVRQLKGKYTAFSAQRTAIKQQEWAVLENKSAGAYAAVSIIPGNCERFGVGTHQLRVVVQHFLEVR